MRRAVVTGNEPEDLDLRRLGLLLLTATGLSARGYVLIRAGRRDRRGTREWRVNVLTDPTAREKTSVGLTLQSALEHVVERLQAAHAEDADQKQPER